MDGGGLDVHVPAPLLRCVQLMVMCVGAYHVGRLFQNTMGLPAITGYIMTGIVVGPFALAVLSDDPSVLNSFKRVEQGCLSIIGFTAGTELVLHELRSQAKAITLIVCCLLPCMAVALYTITTTYLPSNIIFMGYSPEEKMASCLLVSTILLARSPASAIAVVKETRSDGVFTTIAVCASIVLDTCVVSLFSINTNFAHLIVDGTPLTFPTVVQPVVKLALSVVAGYLMSKFFVAAILQPAGSVRDPAARFLLKAFGVFMSGCGAFFFSDTLRLQGTYLRIDPLIACVACGALFANAQPAAPGGAKLASHHGEDFASLMEDSLPWTNVPFFTLVGCGMSFLGLPRIVSLVVAILAARIFALVVGAYFACTMAGLPAEHNHLRWMGFVTQAGVAIGLSKQAAMEFPTWGTSVQSLCVTCILANLLVGPVCFKWLLIRVGEAPAGDDAHEKVLRFSAGPGTPVWKPGGRQVPHAAADAELGGAHGAV